MAGTLLNLSSKTAAGRASNAELTEASAATCSSASTPGTKGQICFDSNFIYVCTVTGAAGAATWKKATLASA